MDKIIKLKASIDPIVKLSDEDYVVFSDAFELVKIKKNDYFLKEGQVCSFLGLLLSGVVIYTKTVESGDSITIHFAFEGDWVNNNLSRLNSSPSNINIKAIEDCEMLVIQQHAIEILYEQIPKLERMGRVLTERAFLKFVEQTIQFQTLSAKERYENLLREFPEIIQKVQQYHIANYLGVAPKSLSRIRKEIVR